MELIETFDLQRISFLKTFTISDIKTYYPSLKNDKERVVELNKIKELCDASIRTGGSIKRVYKYSDDTVRSFGGRLYSKGGIQQIPRSIRGFLMNNSTDIDMTNAHPTILLYLCKKHEIRCPMLSEYVRDRNAVFAELDIPRDEAKHLYLASINNNKLNKKCKNKAFQQFDAELKAIQNKFFVLDEYIEVRDSVPLDKRHNWQGSHLNRILCSFENQILSCAIHTINLRQIEIEVLMFDGLMVKGNFYENSELLEELRIYTESQFPSLDMKWSYKSHDTAIVMPEDFADDNVEIDGCYSQVKAEFEKTHFKVISHETFYTIMDDGSLRASSRSGFATAYEHLTYNYLDNSKKPPVVVKGQFFSKNGGWFKDPDMRCYEYADVYPPDVVCPPNTFNMWVPFAMELVPIGEPTPDALQTFLTHIRIVCGNDQAMADYFCLWIAQMIQFPSVKTIMPTFISKQGAGKGTIMKLFIKMLGNNKVINEMTTPSRDVWGNFNGVMRDAFIVNLDELSGKDSREASGVIKALIKSDTITINQKGVESCVVKSYTRFMCTTNNCDPLSITADDRRNCVIRSSDELCKNVEYFNAMYAILADSNAVRNIYEYFKTMHGTDTFNAIPIPQSEYQKSMIELSISPIEQWIREFALQKSGISKLGSSECFLLFDQWKTDNKIHFEINALKFAVQRARLGIDGVSSIKGAHGSRMVEFDSDKIKAHCKI